jgi:hypothetical protein
VISCLGPDWVSFSTREGRTNRHHCTRVSTPECPHPSGPFASLSASLGRTKCRLASYGADARQRIRESFGPREDTIGQAAECRSHCTLTPTRTPDSNADQDRSAEGSASPASPSHGVSRAAGQLVGKGPVDRPDPAKLRDGPGICGSASRPCRPEFPTPVPSDPVSSRLRSDFHFCASCCAFESAAPTDSPARMSASDWYTRSA